MKRGDLRVTLQLLRNWLAYGELGEDTLLLAGGAYGELGEAMLLLAGGAYVEVADAGHLLTFDSAAGLAATLRQR